jgi:hypothetical protein
MEHQNRRHLMRGIDFCARAADESFTENVSADGEVIRVNLRPYRRRGLPLEGLFIAMRETAQIEGSSEAFMGAWKILKKKVNIGELSIAPNELNILYRELKEKGIVPHHHSEDYQRAYEPAYRVVRRSAFEKYVEKKPDQGF